MLPFPSRFLWLEVCRQSEDPRTLVEGLKLFLPPGSSGLTQERMAHLNTGAAKWQLYEFDERHDEITAVDYVDRGNLATRLVRCPDEAAVLERFTASVDRVLGALPECEVAVLSTAEIEFRWRGLEFARARLAHEPGSFRTSQQIVFGIGAEDALSTIKLQPTSTPWYSGSAPSADHKVAAISRFFGCIQNAGWNRWSSAT